MEGFLTAFIFLFICVTAWAFTNWRKVKKMERLKESVAWSTNESDDIRWNIPLWGHFKNAQNRSNVSEKYRISGDEEWQAVKNIISRYQQELARSYFDGRLWALDSIYGIDGRDYFIYMLYIYLCENESYGQHTVFRLRSNEIGNRNTVFYKMFYITYMYCKSSQALQKNVPSWNEGRLKEILDKEI